MSDVTLKCGYRMAEEDIARILSSGIEQMVWHEELVHQHADIHDVRQWSISPVSVAGVVLPIRAIAYVIRTEVLQGEDQGAIWYSVESSADFIVPGRVHYSYTERKSIDADSKSEAMLIVLSEIKRFMTLNV